MHHPDLPVMLQQSLTAFRISFTSGACCWSRVKWHKHTTVLLSAIPLSYTSLAAPRPTYKEASALFSLDFRRSSPHESIHLFKEQSHGTAHSLTPRSIHRRLRYACPGCSSILCSRKPLLYVNPEVQSSLVSIPRQNSAPCLVFSYTFQKTKLTSYPDL